MAKEVQGCYISHPKFLIHSIKRLSDGEVFTVGDRICWIDNSGDHTILEFRMGNSLRGGNTIFAKYSKFCSQDIHGIKHFKKPLFVTEDGVELMNRTDEIFAIVKGEYNLMHQHNGRTLSTWLNGWYTTQWLPNPSENDKRVLELIKKHYLLFSTKEAAENYIKMNKPVLSLRDVLDSIDAYKDYRYEIRNMLKVDLTKLVKSKL